MGRKTKCFWYDCECTQEFVRVPHAPNSPKKYADINGTKLTLEQTELWRKMFLLNCRIEEQRVSSLTNTKIWVCRAHIPDSTFGSDGALVFDSVHPEHSVCTPKFTSDRSLGT